MTTKKSAGTASPGTPLGACRAAPRQQLQNLTNIRQYIDF
jgi:hypothetical protein